MSKSANRYTKKDLELKLCKALDRVDKGNPHKKRGFHRKRRWKSKNEMLKRDRLAINKYRRSLEQHYNNINK